MPSSCASDSPLIPYRPSTAALLVAVATAFGFALRVALVDQSLSSDELSSYWLVARHTGLSGVWDVVHTDAEITPPLYYSLAKLTTQIDATPAMMRLPSLLAGTASIPLTYLVGERTVGRQAGVAAATLAAVSPFMINLSAEARAYGLAVFLVLLSTVALLRALDGGGVGWWVLYGAASCAAMYSQYTAAFALAAQALWALWANPGARRPVIYANLGAAIAWLPWIPGVVEDFGSPTRGILNPLFPFTADHTRYTLEHLWIGSPYGLFPLDQIPGTPALILLGAGVAIGVAGLLESRRGVERSPPRERRPRRLALVAAIAAGVLGGEALFSLLSTNLFGIANLAVAWPACALLLAALLCAGRRPLAIAATVLAAAGLAWGGVRMLETQYQRPDFGSAASYILDHSHPPGAVVVAHSPNPGPLSPIDAEIRSGYRIFRLGFPRRPPGDPFAPSKPLPSPAQVAAGAVAASGAGPIYFITPYIDPDLVSELRKLGIEAGPYDGTVSEVIAALPPGYRLLHREVYDGQIQMALVVYGKEGDDRAAG
jgi:4-amino-4-deoxy-L-arabinose transferase-like glycosyltransferase